MEKFLLFFHIILDCLGLLIAPIVFYYIFHIYCVVVSRHNLKRDRLSFFLFFFNQYLFLTKKRSYSDIYFEWVNIIIIHFMKKKLFLPNNNYSHKKDIFYAFHLFYSLTVILVIGFSRIVFFL